MLSVISTNSKSSMKRWVQMPICDASHDGHDCSVPGACRCALSEMLARISERDRGERERVSDTVVIWPDSKLWHPPLASGTETRAVRPN